MCINFQIIGKQPDCILNNEDKKNLVCDQWYIDQLPDSTVAASIGLTNDQVDYFIGTCPPGTVYGKTIVENGICADRYAELSENETLANFYKYNATQVNETYYSCPPLDLTDSVKEVICILKRDGYDESYFIDKYYLYNSTQISETYHGCSDLEYSEADAIQTCKYAAYGWTPDDEDFGWVYQTLIGKYGIDAVNAKVYECNVAAGKRKDTSMHKVLIDLYERGHPSRHHLKQILKKRIQTLEEDQIDHLKKKVRER